MLHQRGGGPPPRDQAGDALRLRQPGAPRLPPLRRTGAACSTSTTSEALARRRRASRPSDGLLATVTTSVTEIRPDGPDLPGRAAPSIWLEHRAFEAVADLLWQPSPARGSRPTSGPPRSRTRRPAALGGRHERVRSDPLRSDLRPTWPSRGRRGRSSPPWWRRSARSRVGCCRGARSPTDSRPPLPSRSRAGAPRRGPRRPGAPGRPRAGHLDGGGPDGRVDPRRRLRRGAGRPGHGRRPAARRGEPVWRTSCSRTPAGARAAAALDDALRWQRPAPRVRAPRSTTATRGSPSLVAVRRAGLSPTDRLEVVAVVQDLAARTRAAPTRTSTSAWRRSRFAVGMDAEAGGVLFKVARVVGWVAHYLEELHRAPAALPGAGRATSRRAADRRRPVARAVAGPADTVGVRGHRTTRRS